MVLTSRPAFTKKMLPLSVAVPSGSFTLAGPLDQKGSRQSALRSRVVLKVGEGISP